MARVGGEPVVRGPGGRSGAGADGPRAPAGRDRSVDRGGGLSHALVEALQAPSCGRSAELRTVCAAQKNQGGPCS